MKKNRLLILSLCALSAATLSLTACSGCNDTVGDYLNGLKTTADNAVTVDAEIKLSDSGVTVYTFRRHMEINTEDRTATISDTKITLADNFEEAATVSSSSVNDVTGSTLIGLKLTNKLVSDYEIEDGGLVCTVPKGKISEVLTKSVSASSDMKLTITADAGVLNSIEYSYTNSSSRTVSVTVTYGY